MKEFVLYHREMLDKIPKESYLITEDQFKKLILENNEGFTYWNSSWEDSTHVRCENRPRDCPLLGVYWHECCQYTVKEK